MIDSHDRFFETTRDILWLNVTVHSQSEVYMAVRQLEFALFQLTQRVDQLLAAIQYALQGKLPVTLIGSSVLYDIVRNVSFHLPGGYELVAGTTRQNIFFYYELITVAMFGDSHSLRLIMKIPMKTTEQLFALYELVALPEIIKAEGKFVKYSLEYPFFGLSLSRRDYVLLSAADVQKCTKGSPKVCPANMPLYDAKTPSCEASLFFPDTRRRQQMQEEPAPELLNTHPAEARYSMGVPFPEEVAGYHPLFTRHQLGNTRENPLREWLYSQRHFLFSLHPGGQDAARTTQDRLRPSGHPCLVRARPDT